MVSPHEVEPVDPDALDILIAHLGDEGRSRALLEAVNEHGYALVSVRQEAIEKAVMILSGILPGIPAAALIQALADEGVFVLARPEMRQDIVSLADNTLLGTHPADRCTGRHCCIHNPSDHPLKNAPLHWNDVMRRTERECSHGQLHPDADHLSYVLETFGMLDYFRHKHHRPCDGCCRATPAVPTAA